MSIQALNWAISQKTGSPQSKLVLLLLANYADESGICWPSQISLVQQSEQSDDTVQRHLKAMEGRFIARARTRRTKGRWPGYVYQLLIHAPLAATDLQDEPTRKRLAREAIRRAKTDPPPPVVSATHPTVTNSTTPLSAARTEPLSAVSPGRFLRCHRAAESGVEPSIEPSGEPSQPEPSPATAAAPPRLRSAALQGKKPVRLDLIHNEIAQRLGTMGWSILQRMNADQLAQIEGLQRKGMLTEAAIVELREEAWLEAQKAKPR